MRTYYKCHDCLEPYCLDGGLPPGWICPYCGSMGKQEMMGIVRGIHLVKDSFECPCDARCTGATGPHCECPCKGENHGSGRMIRISTAVDDGQKIIAMAETADSRKSAAWKAGESYRSLVQKVRDAMVWRFGPEDVKRFKENRWIQNREKWEKMRTIMGDFRWARDLKTHGKRNKNLMVLNESLRNSEVRV